MLVIHTPHYASSLCVLSRERRAEVPGEEGATAPQPDSSESSCRRLASGSVLQTEPSLWPSLVASCGLYPLPPRAETQISGSTERLGEVTSLEPRCPSATSLGPELGSIYRLRSSHLLPLTGPRL
ncbi:hypothetical protein AAFF_G00300860 [Aldrovandia affinis]|uniref:Uncharacterized protein n=1 Tax=Aldrovandia affinis TaxID=143900 RepID=A0AAD7WRF1_9TELE|nr:hypothetical protein AAFF_G00300860 [Aldrovandia affinis]